MAKPPPAKKPEPEKPANARATLRVLPMDLQVGDRLADESGEWEVIGRPYTTAVGKNAHVRVQRVGSAVTIIRVGRARDRIVVRRG